MMKVGLLGAGRIGHMHANTIRRHSGSQLTLVFDMHGETAKKLATEYGAKVAETPQDVFENVDAVVVASPTETHCDLIEASVAAGVPVLCEKPLDLEVDRVRRCFERIRDRKHFVQVGFCRRFDRNFQELRKRVAEGRVGKVESIHVITRVVTPPTHKFAAESGGLFKDMMIHDIDIARFILNQEPIAVFARGSTLIDPKLAEFGDVDSAKMIAEFPGGVLLSVDNSRRCVYGFDHRVEVFGSEGMLSVRNAGAPEVFYSNKQGTDQRSLLHASPIYGYQEAFDGQWNAFAEAVQAKQESPVPFIEGWNALAIATAAGQSLRSGAMVDPTPLLAS